MTSSTNNALYLNLKRKVAVLNYNYKYPADVFTLLNSTELLNVIQLFLQQRHHSNRSNSFEDLTAADYRETIKNGMLDRPQGFERLDLNEILHRIED